MHPEAARRLRVRRHTLVVLGTLLGGFLLVTLTSLGLYVGFPPAIWWAQRLNRWEFQRHQDRYREIAGIVKRDMAGAKPGTHLFWGIDGVSLRKLEAPVPEADLIRLFEEGRLVEAHQYRSEFAMRIMTRRPWRGGYFNLVYWDPQPNPDCVWWRSDWWQNDSIEWMDSRWWSTYCSGSPDRTWDVQPRGPEGKRD